MTLGKKLKNLRIEKGLTQKDLADQLHVTFQTVSKWENDENEPDVATLRELARLYGCSLDYLLSEDDTVAKHKVETVEQSQPVNLAPAAPNTAADDVKLCAYCHKGVLKSIAVSKNYVQMSDRHGRHARHVVSTETRYYHPSCLKKLEDEIEANEKKRKDEKASKAKKRIFGWSIAMGIVAFVVPLIIFLAVPACREAINPGLSVLYSFLISLGVFTDLYCILSGSYIGEVFVAVSGLSIKFPGIIFSWDIDGVIWAISMKILFAILGFLGGIAILLLAIVISAALAIVSFPFVLIHNIRNNYEDAL